MNKKLLIPAVAIVGVIAVTGAYGVSKTMANKNDSGYPAIIDKLAERFNLNEDEVNGFFQEQRKEKREEMQKRYEERLNQAVSEGKITEEQKKIILAKKEELKSQRQENRENRERHREELKKWMEENGINLDYPFGPMEKRHGEWRKGLK